MCKRYVLARDDNVGMVESCTCSDIIHITVGSATIHLSEDHFLFMASMLDNASEKLLEIAPDIVIKSYENYSSEESCYTGPQTRKSTVLAKKAKFGQVGICSCCSVVSIHVAGISLHVSAERFILLTSLMAEAYSNFMDRGLEQVLNSFEAN